MRYIGKHSIDQVSSLGLLWFCIQRRASRMLDCRYEIFCESDQLIQKLKSYEQLKEKSKSVLSSEDFKEQHINCEERKCFWTSSSLYSLVLNLGVSRIMYQEHLLDVIFEADM